MSATADDRIRATGERAIAAMEAHREAGPYILAETAPLAFPSRPAAPMPGYLHPDYVPRERALLIARAERVGLADEVRKMLGWKYDRASRELVGQRSRQERRPRQDAAWPGLV